MKDQLPLPEVMDHKPVKRFSKKRRDPKIGKPDRPCANCGESFSPTRRRRLLCLGCFTGTKWRAHDG